MNILKGTLALAELLLQQLKGISNSLSKNSLFDTNGLVMRIRITVKQPV